MPLRKSVVKLMFDMFTMTKLKYGDLRLESVGMDLVRSWFSSQTGLRASERRYAFSDLLDAFYKVRV